MDWIKKPKRNVVSRYNGSLNHVFIGVKYKDSFGLPGGKVEETDASLIDAAVREFQEEIDGLEILGIAPLISFVHDADKDDPDQTKWWCHVFEAVCKQTKELIDDKVNDRAAVWYSVEDYCTEGYFSALNEMIFSHYYGENFQIVRKPICRNSLEHPSQFAQYDYEDQKLSVPKVLTKQDRLLKKSSAVGPSEFIVTSGFCDCELRNRQWNPITAKCETCYCQIKKSTIS